MRRFLSKVSLQITSGCWVWTGFRNAQGYGHFALDGYKVGRAHRASWVLHRGSIPTGLCVLHRCDNPSCVNPDHLFLGTDADNAHDRDAKGRGKPWVKASSSGVSPAVR